MASARGVAGVGACELFAIPVPLAKGGVPGIRGRAAQPAQVAARSVVEPGLRPFRLFVPAKRQEIHRLGLADLPHRAIEHETRGRGVPVLVDVRADPLPGSVLVGRDLDQRGHRADLGLHHHVHLHVVSPLVAGGGGSGATLEPSRTVSIS